MSDYTDSGVAFGDSAMAAAALRKLADVAESTTGSVPAGELYLAVTLSVAAHSTMPEAERVAVVDAISYAVFGRPAGPEEIAGKSYHNAGAWASKDLPGVHFKTGTSVAGPEAKERAALQAQIEELRRQRDELAAQLPAVAGEAGPGIPAPPVDELVMYELVGAQLPADEAE